MANLFPFNINSYECRPSVKIKQLPVLGIVNDVSFLGGILTFRIGVSRYEMFGLDEKPKWFVDGTEVEVDFENNCITKT